MDMYNHYLIGILWIFCIFMFIGNSSLNGFRIFKKENLDALSTTPPIFEPYQKGFVGYYGDPENFKRERVNEGAPDTMDQPNIFSGRAAKQICPGMVGPLDSGSFYCRGREYGYCDRRSGTCFCNIGYQGLDCFQCTPTHYRKGSLCYPKHNCPSDCSLGGTCDYETGICKCFEHRTGEDCSIPLCLTLDTLCISCTNTTCLECIEGYTLKDGSCSSCAEYDPRCLTCNDNKCIQCADPLLWSIRRSGKRSTDPDLPFDELTREFSFEYPYGSQNPLVFQEAEVFYLSNSNTPLKNLSMTCAQGLSNTNEWKCTPYPVSHIVCGHIGTFNFVSPAYEINENSEYIRISVFRSGGGLGATQISYELRHLTTSNSDVLATAFYTTSQTLDFANGVVEMSFLVTIIDDKIYESDEKFMLYLRDPKNGAILGATHMTIVTVLDDDQLAIDSQQSFIMDEEKVDINNVFIGEVKSFSIHVYTGDGTKLKTGGAKFVIESRRTSEYDQDDDILSFHHLESINYGYVQDNGDGTYNCTWEPTDIGSTILSIYQLVQGGLQGFYYTNLDFQDPYEFSRIDREVNYNWGDGKITSKASDQLAVRWKGYILAPSTESLNLHVQTAGRVRVWIENELVIDLWHESGMSSTTSIIADAGSYYNIVLEYITFDGESFIILEWSSNSISKRLIPQSNLFYPNHIRNSPFTNIVVSTGDAKAENCVVSGRHIYETIVDEQSTFNFWLRDSKYNHIKKPLLYQNQIVVEFNLIGNDGGGYGSIGYNGEVQWNNEIKCFEIHYHPTLSGNFSVDVKLDGVNIYGSPFHLTVLPGEAHGTYSTLSGSGITTGRTVGVLTSVTIQSRDTRGNALTKGGYNYEIKVYNPSKDVLDYGQVDDLGNGVYIATYAPTFAGTNLIYITLDGVNVQNSPYTVEVNPNAPYGPNCVAEGEAISKAETGIPNNFNIQARDIESNDLVSGGATTSLVIIGPNEQPISGIISDHKNGKYRGTYTPVVIGKHFLQVTFEGKEISGSPFEVDVKGGPTSGALCKVSGSGASTATAGEITSFMVQVTDIYGNDKTYGGFDTISITLSGQSIFSPIVSYSGYGQYLVSYVANTAGVWDLTVSIEGVDIVAGPFSVTVLPGPLYANNTLAASTHSKTFMAGEIAPITINAKDYFGNELISGNHHFFIHGSGPEDIFPPVVDLKSGKYDVKFRPLMSGIYNLRFQVYIPGGLNGTYYGSNDFIGTILNKRIDPFIAINFQYYAPIGLQIAEEFSIRWEGFILPKYTEKYTFSIRADEGVRLTVDNKMIIDKFSSSSFQHFGRIILEKDKMTNIKIEYIERKREANIGMYWESISQRKEIVPSNRLYTLWNIKNDILKPLVVPAPSNPTSFTAHGDSLTKGIAGEPSSFTIIARDEFGNQRLTGGDQIFVFIEGNSDPHVSPDIVDNNDGSYTVSYTPYVAGVFSCVIASKNLSNPSSMGALNLQARLSQDNIKGSPFRLIISPSRFYPEFSTISGYGSISGTAGKNMSVLFEPRDAFGNPIYDTNPEYIQIQLVSLADESVKVKILLQEAINKNGFPATYLASQSGRYQYEISYNKEPYRQSNLFVTISPGKASPFHSIVSGAGITSDASIKTGIQTEFMVQLKDIFGNDLNYGGNDIIVNIRGPENVRGTVDDLQSGEYYVSYIVSKPGLYRVFITLLTSFGGLLGGGGGLTGKYYMLQDFLGPSEIPVIDSVISFDWNKNLAKSEYRSIRWKGYMKPDYSETYTLFVSIKGFSGVITIDGNEIMHEINIPSVGQEYQYKIDLKASYLHEIIIEYQRGSTLGLFSLAWQSDQTPYGIIPPSFLYPEGVDFTGSPYEIVSG